MWQRTFLYRVFQTDRLLFGIISLFIVGQLFFSAMRMEQTPFFQYGMYSAIHHGHDSYTVYTIRVDTQSIYTQDFYDYQRELVYGTIAEYDALKHNHFNDPLDQFITKHLSGGTAAHARRVLLNNAAMDTPYQKWLFGYIADMRMVRNPVINVAKQQVRYLPDGRLADIDSPSLVFHLRDE